MKFNLLKNLRKTYNPKLYKSTESICKEFDIDYIWGGI